MQIIYEVIEKDEDRHSIVVRFTTAVLDENKLDTGMQRREGNRPFRCKTDLNIELPIPLPTGDALHLYILSRAPAEWLAREEVLDAIPQGTMTLDTIALGSTCGRTTEQINAGLRVAQPDAVSQLVTVTRV